MYIIKRIKSHDFEGDVRRFVTEGAEHANRVYGNKYDWKNFPILDFIDSHYFAICFRNDKPVGFICGTLTHNGFDRKIITLRQTLLYAVPKTRATLLLLKDFIDFGKENANHIITGIGTETNIKPKSLEKLGFKHLEQVFRLEV